jgi:hypothetical protein
MLTRLIAAALVVAIVWFALKATERASNDGAIRHYLAGAVSAVGAVALIWLLWSFAL